MRATLKDVAKLAGTDVTSVSRTLSGSPRAKELRPETRERILAAAERLGYCRNALARTVRTGENPTVAVISSDDNLRVNIAAYKVLVGILQEAMNQNFGMKIYHDDDLPQCLREILGNQIKHVISMSVEAPKREETALLCRKHGLKLVYVSERAHHEFPAVNVDNFDGARQVVAHLAALGHQRIALLCVPHRYHYVDARHAGYSRGMEEAGLELNPRLVSCAEDDQLEAVVTQMLQLPPKSRPTAFFAIGDYSAMIVQRLAASMKLRVPEDISTFGFGDTGAAPYAYSPLCSVMDDTALVGKTALSLVLGKECEVVPDAMGNYLLPMSLVLRESTHAMVENTHINA